MDTILVPTATTVVAKTPGLRFTFSVIVRITIAERAGLNVYLFAVLHVSFLLCLLDIDGTRALLSNCLQHPYQIITVHLKCIGKVKATAPALGPCNNK